MLQTAVDEGNHADPSRTLQQAYTPKGCGKMVELPQGDVTEVRRGDRDALRVLSSDMAKLSTTGFIRTERKPKEAMPRIGHILFLEGHPTLAIHEGDAIVFGLEALLEIEDDAMPLETLLAVHELPMDDAQRVAALHPNAYLHLEAVEGEANQEDRWWSKVKLQPGSWRREERLPELEVSVEAPEAVRQRSRAYMQRHEGLERMIHPGDALLFDAQDPSSLFSLAGHLANHGRPILVISRHDIDSMSVEHNLPMASCHWLSTSEHPRALAPALEQVRNKIDAFLWENMRAVVVLEGLEYLAGINGDGRTIDFIRDVVDGVRMDDHVLLTTADMNAFELEPRHRMGRCLTAIQPIEIEHWLTEPDLILDHPLCAPPTEEERDWIEQQLKRGLEHSPVLTTSGHEGSEIIGGHEPASEADRQEATAALGEHVRSWVEQEAPAVTETTTTGEQHLVAEVASVSIPKEPSSVQPAPPVPIMNSVELPKNPQPRAERKPAVQPKPVPKGPRPAQRLRRKKRNMMKAKTAQHVQTMAAVAHAPLTSPEFPTQSIENKPAAIATQLEDFEKRQKAALTKTFQPRAGSNKGLLDASLQSSATKQHRLPPVGRGPRPMAAIATRKPNNPSTPMTPLSARPGVDTEAKPKHLPREIASKEQTSPSIEDSLSSWELEDMQRLRQEREGGE